MKQRVKRILAFMLALLLVFSSTCVSPVGVVDVFATGIDEGEASGTAGSESGGTAGGESGEGAGAAGTVPTTVDYTVVLPAKIRDVEWGTVKVNNVSATTAEGSVKVTLSNDITEAQLKNVTSDNYVFSDISVSGTTITINKALPNCTIEFVSGDNTLTVGESADYVVKLDNLAWENYVSWSLESLEGDFTEIAEDSSDKKKVTVTAKDEGFPGNSASVTIKASLPDGARESKTIALKKKTASLSISIQPEDVTGWNEKRTVKVSSSELAGKTVHVTLESETKPVTLSSTSSGKAEGTVDWTLSHVGTYTFTASFDGDNVYKSCSSSLNYETSKEDQESFTFVDNEDNVLTGISSDLSGKSLVYDKDTEVSLAKLKGGITPERYDFACTNDTGNMIKDTLKVEDGVLKFTPKAAGTFTITVTKKHSDYNDASEKLTVTVAKKQINLVKVKAVDKIYDGNTDITVTAKLKPEDLEADERADGSNVELTVFGTAVDKNAAENKTVSYEKFTFDTNDAVQNALNDNYVINNLEDDERTTTVNINKKKLALEVVINDQNSKDPETGALLREFTDYKNCDGVSVTVTGFIGEEGPASLEGYKAPVPVVDDSVVNRQFAPGTVIANAIVPDITNVNATNNYEFDTINAVKASLKMAAQSIDLDKLLSVDNGNSTNAYQNSESKKIYFGNNPAVKWSINNSVNLAVIRPEYTKVLLSQKDGNKWSDWSDVTLGYIPRGLEIDAVSIKLQTADGGETVPKEYGLIRDTVAPSVYIAIDSVNSAYDFASKVTFGMFKSAAYQAVVTGEDDFSGQASWKCYVINLTEDKTFDKDGLRAVVENQDPRKEDTGSFGESGQSVFLGKVNENETAVNGRYLVIVLVTDNVGNNAIYASNGVIVDQVALDTLELKYTQGDGIEEPKLSGQADGIEYFKNKASVYAVANDANTDGTVYSGVKKITAKVQKEAEEAVPLTMYTVPVDEETGKVNVTDTLENLKNNYVTISTDQLSREAFPNSVIEKMASTDTPCAKYTVSIEAEDFAGNAFAEAASKTFVVDNLAPVVTNSVILNTDENKFDQNIYYSNEAITLETTVTERFTDLGKIDLVLTKDGEEIRKSFSSWEQAIVSEEYPGYAISVVENGNSDANDFSRTIKFTVPAENNEGDFSFYVTAEDCSGNASNTVTPINFCMDTTAPIVDITYTAKPTAGDIGMISPSDSRVYLDENYDYFTANIQIKEKHFYYTGKTDENIICTYGASANNQTEDITDTVTVTTIKTSDVQTVKAAAENITTESNWVAGLDDIHTYGFTCDKDAEYTFNEFTVTDLAGNTCVYTENTFNPAQITLDTVRPTAKLTVTDLVAGGSKGKMSWTLLLNKLTFGLFGKNQVVISMTSDDVTAGVNTTEYIIASDLRTLDQLKAETAWNPYKDDLTLKNNQDYVVYEKVVDKAGNTEYFSTDRIIVDAVDPKPEVTIKPTVPGWGKDVYSATDKPGFDVDVIDPINNDSYAGLKEITYTIKNGTTGFVESGTLASYKAADHTQEYTGHVNIDPAKFYSNDVQVTVEANDYSTNDATTETISIKVDNQEPKVNFTFDTSDASNGKYYNKEKRLTITVDERNFDDTYKPEVTSSTGNGWSFSGWTHNGETHTGTVTFSGDADYTVSYFCYDLAGNKSETVTMDEITIDKTKPVIAVSYNNNSVLNNSYYKESRTATITITEHNFNPADVTVTTTARLDGATVAVPGVSGWSGGGDTHTATISYAADADYTFTISTTDMASNVSDPYDTESFTVDMTQPAVEITAIEDKSANNGVVAPVITLEDINFDRNNVVVRLCGVNKGAVDTAGMYTVANSAKGQVITFADFGKNMDDIYTLTAEATDMAGNTFSTSKTFSVNRDGSTYMYEEYTEDLINKGYTHDPKDIVVTEVNVDTLTFRELTLSKNGTQLTLAEGTDYEVLASGSEVSWKSYTYTIKASNFEDEGEYAISIYSEDRAANKTTNTSKKKDITFIVDKTSPVISVSNIEDGGRYKADSQAFIANVDDNMALDKVEYYLDGEMKQSFTADEVAEVNGELNLTVGSSNKFQKVIIKAYDKAENEPTEAKLNILVTTNAFVQYYNNKPVFYGSIGGGVVLIGGAVVAGIHFSGEKKDKQKKN